MIVFFRTHAACNGAPCAGAMVETSACLANNPQYCIYQDWQAWSACSETRCGVEGVRQRSATFSKVNII